MLDLLAFLYNPTKDQLQIAENCLKTLSPYQTIIVSSPSQNFKDYIAPNRVAITFGKLATTLVKQEIESNNILSVKLVELPSLKELVREEQYKKQRTFAYNTLLSLKEFLSSGLIDISKLIVKDSDLPDLDSNKVLLLHKLLQSTSRVDCLLISKNGRKVLVVTEQSDRKDVDLVITFEELFAIKTAMEVLKVKEVSLVLKKS